MEVTQEVVGDLEDMDFLFEHFRGLGSKALHSHRDLDVAEGRFGAPAAMRQLCGLLRGSGWIP